MGAGRQPVRLLRATMGMFWRLLQPAHMAKEFGERGIRANAVSPGSIRTELGGGLTAQFEALLASQTALGRIGEPDEVARVIAMLLSDDAAWINGQSIEVAGGYVV